MSVFIFDADMYRFLPDTLDGIAEVNGELKRIKLAKSEIVKITSGGEININSKVENSQLLVEIRNSGHLENDALKNSKGFGINNTKHRLNLLFGETASFSLTNENGGKVLAKLIIPINPE